jgi:hypothetical protein
LFGENEKENWNGEKESTERSVEVEQMKGICSGNTLPLGEKSLFHGMGENKYVVVTGSIHLIYLKIHLRKGT